MYARLSHEGQGSVNRLAKCGLLYQTTRAILPKCELCLATKAAIKPFDKILRASSLFEFIYSNICGPMNVKTCHGITYYLQYRYVYLLSH